MTQALLNNLINNTQQTFAEKVVGQGFAQTDFQNVLEKQTSLQEKAETIKESLGTLKKPVENTFQKLQDKINAVSKEVGGESALDISLAKADDEGEIDAKEDIPIESTDGETSDNTIVDTAVQNLMQQILQTQPVQINQIQQVQEVAKEVEQGLEAIDEELHVTLNGIDLDKVLEDFGLNNTEDLPEVKTLKTEIAEETDGKSLEELVDEDTLRELNIESVEADTSSGEEESADLMQNQTAEEQGVKAMLHADADFGEVKAEVQSNVSTQAPKSTGNSDVTPSKIIDQISKQMENMNTGSRVNIVLNPESLGKVSVQLINTKEGLSAQFTVATQDARNLILKGLDGLKDTLLTQGVNVDNVTVKLSETQESEYNADWTEQEGSRGGNKEQGSNKGQKEKEKFEEMMSFVNNEEN